MELFSYSNLVHAIAGGSGSAVAMSALFPLDTVRTRLQLEEGRTSKNTFLQLTEIYKQEGIGGLYRGLLPVIESLYCSNFVYFYTFHGLRRVANEDKAAVKDLLLAMLAGSVNVMMTNPLWVVNTRLKMQGAKVTTASTSSSSNQASPSHRHYKGMLDGLLKVRREEGIAGLWSGAASSLVLTINPAIQFMVYEAMKRQAHRVSGGKQMSSLAVFGVGATAKAIATILTYPIQLVQAKQRHGHSYEGLPQKAGLIPIMFYIIRRHGFWGLFKGLEAKLLQTVLTAALMFVCYEKIAAVVFAVLVGRKKDMMVKH
ncbi:hypothetical protein Pmani_032861 [Petrolisthes manimaculis]|uniref:Peroxisomal membrane protein PMP34 n=1 Tax=Petrolisthes manimaculis TaxID=1843537 RepID=A0AAE1NQV6_9EUCA|nr:hypothetical protein Pmani_032861 [Petrolisthes manimaculis]